MTLVHLMLRGCKELSLIVIYSSGIAALILHGIFLITVSTFDSLGQTSVQSRAVGDARLR